MAQVLLAWELGAHLGHLARLGPVARALVARGHAASHALRDVTRARAMLGAAAGQVFQAPLAVQATPRAAWTLADVLLSCGYADAQGLAGLVDAWRSVFDATGCEVVVADHAPTALLAARAAGLPAVHIGHGFSIPPRVSPLPVFRDWAPPPDGHAADIDTRVLDTVNEVLTGCGAAPLGRLCDLFYPERTMLCAWPETDHYAGVGRGPDDHLGPDCAFAPGVAIDWPAGTGPHVLAYLRTSHPGHVDLLRALAALGLPTLCHLPGIDPAAEPVRAPTLRYSQVPIDLQRALPRSSLVVCHAGQATVAQALRLGIPVLMLPEHAEQHLLARQVERSGAGVNAASQPQPVGYAALVAAMVRTEGPHAQAARALAARHGGFDPLQLAQQIALAAESLVG